MANAVLKAKGEIYGALCETESSLSADKRFAVYQEALGMFVCRRLSKAELDRVVVRALGAENIRKHNALLLALLSDATRRASHVREGTSVAATWSRVLAATALPATDDDHDVDDDVKAVHRGWREADLAAPTPRAGARDLPRHSVCGNARLDGAGLVALKMDDISLGLGLEGVSASAVHLMTIALHAYATKAVRQCHTELADQRHLDAHGCGAEHSATGDDASPSHHQQQSSPR